MKQGSTLFLKSVIVAIASAVLTGMIWLPQLEGRNINADLFTIYFKDPFLAYMYATSIPFFVALYQGIRLLGYIDRNQAFSNLSVKALRNIKVSAVMLSVMFCGAMPYIFMYGEEDNAPGVVLIGLVIVFTAVVVATFAAILQRLFQNAVDLKSENDLTV